MLRGLPLLFLSKTPDRIDLGSETVLFAKLHCHFGVPKSGPDGSKHEINMAGSVPIELIWVHKFALLRSYSVILLPKKLSTWQ